MPRPPRGRGAWPPRCRRAACGREIASPAWRRSRGRRRRCQGRYSASTGSLAGSRNPTGEASVAPALAPGRARSAGHARRKRRAKHALLRRDRRELWDWLRSRRKRNHARRLSSTDFCSTIGTSPKCTLRTVNVCSSEKVGHTCERARVPPLTQSGSRSSRSFRARFQYRYGGSGLHFLCRKRPFPRL
jgi:hypothetical protein